VPSNNSAAAAPFLRCSLTAPNGDGVVSLEGASAGVFIPDAELNSNPAIDISGLAHVVVTLMLRGAGSNRIKAGDICGTSDRAGNTFLCMALCLQPPPSPIYGFALLDDAHRGQITRNALNPFYIGSAAVVPLDES